MEWLVWIGAAVSVLGLAGIVWCIVRVARAKRQNLPDDRMRAILQQVLPLNVGALMLSGFGLAMVVAGVLLG